MNLKPLFKVKGASRFETIENASFLLMGLGILLMIVGFSLSTGSSSTIAGSLAIFGSFLFFAFLVILILALFIREIRSNNNNQEKQ